MDGVQGLFISAYFRFTTLHALDGLIFLGADCEREPPCRWRYLSHA
jgi:hypothetical protein